MFNPTLTGKIEGKGLIGVKYDYSNKAEPFNNMWFHNVGFVILQVSRKSKPPVCRIMDYHKEKYKQQMKESAKKNKACSPFLMPVFCNVASIS